MEKIILVLLHAFRAWYPDSPAMTELDTVKNKRIIPIDDQPDQV